MSNVTVKSIGAVVAALRRHVQHSRHAVDLLLDRCRHGVGYYLRARPRIIDGDRHARRRDVGILRHGKVNSARNPISVMTTERTVAKIGRSMKKFEMMAWFLAYSLTCWRLAASVWSGQAAAAASPWAGRRSVGIVVRSGRTSICGRICGNPPTTTQSSAFIPSVTTRRPSGCNAPVVMRRDCTCSPHRGRIHTSTPDPSRWLGR